MAFNLTGATRLYLIVGDPIAQVKSPGGMTAGFAARGHDAVVAPVQVSVADLPDFLRVADRLQNLDGIIVTVPHKFACFAHCAATSDSARFIGAVNIMRRQSGGGWFGEMVDGHGFVAAACKKGFAPSGQRALLIGAGGAGSAIAQALLASGVRELAIHDADAGRRDALIARLQTMQVGLVSIGSTDPTGFDFVGNATPAGMREGDALPVDVSKLKASMFVGCVVTVPAVPPLIAAARARGCRTSTGIDMYQASQDTMLDFYLEPPRAS
jgi:shikimate dehydrogenase